MNIELISHPVCPFVHRSAIMLAEKGVSFGRRDVDLKNKPEWFLAISPRGKVPLVIVDGQTLFESSAINEFLDETRSPRIMPEDPWERARQRAWIEVANDLLLTQFALFAAPESEISGARAKLEPVLGRFEEALVRGTIDGEALGLVHIAVAPALHRFVVFEERVGKRFLEATPRLEALAHRLAVRPSVASTVPSDFAERFIDILAARGSGLVASLSARPASTPVH